jgi:glyoxylase-like metal-dependent hydrolase (beta-lactamase superfamily II)
VKKRLCILCTFGIFTSLSFLVTRTGAQAGSVKQIVPGVWFREGDLENMGHCNNTIIEMKDYLIVVDANYPGGARLALAAAKKISNKPIKYVFDTHHHGDHAYGNPIWTQAGAITLAYKGVVEEMKRYEPARWQAAVKERQDVRDMHLDVPEPPTQTFDESPLIIKDGAREVRFYFFGWAHTRGDGFVYLPREKVLCTGDAVVNGPFNFTADGNVGNWPSVVRVAQKLDVEHVLPGHGAPGGKDVLDGEIEFMTELYRAVNAAISRGKKLEDIVPPGKTKLVYGDVVPAFTTVVLPDNVKNWIGPFLPAQVKDTYEEISHNTPHGDLPH